MTGRMSATFSFAIDRIRGLVTITMAGLFSHADIRDFLDERRKAHAALDCPPNMHVTLNDVRGMKIQPQDTVAGFQEMLAAPEYRSRRLAFVAGRTLARSQLMRALGNRDARCFEDVADAEAWLFAEEHDSAPRRAFG
ncbi:MAG: hypothetical protein WC804_09050 [Sphingomonas sp.]|jgi:hypothetical protein|uniref:hypothetical protein n=1 Tax=Sphingomonas sp. TaxID=28214 RepID=UPI00356B084F